MDAILERCAGLDVHQKTVVACVLYGPLDRKPQKEIKTFSTTTRDLLALQDWLLEYECTHVAMESTGVFWKPVWNVLEGAFELVLGNAQRIKNVPGRKTDVNDAMWIAQLLRCGLIESSFVPSEDLRDLRDLTRYRRKLVQTVTTEKNRIHKILQDGNIKLTTYLSDLFGKSGRALLESVVNGEVLSPEQIESMVYSTVKKKVPELVDALNGRVRLHHRRMIQDHLDHLQFLESKIEKIEADIDAYVNRYQEELNLIRTIPGIEDAAAGILAEIGVDMTVFPTENHLASWAGVSPRNHESAEKKKSTRTQKHKNGLKSLLCQVAWAASRKKNSRIASFYHRILKRRGEKKAAMATAHLILRIIYRMLTEKKPYQELGWDYSKRKEPNLTHWVRKIKELGFEVHLQELV